MNHISLLIKPASGLCNMRCKYCFYYDIMENREIDNYEMMTLKTLEKLVFRAFEDSGLSVSFIFQGGEPTLVGLQFYRELIKFVEKYNKHKVPTYYSIQTNGTKIDSNFAKFLKQNNFLVGISIDGNEEIHNKYRISKDRSGSFAEVKKGLDYLSQYEVDYNILSVVTENTVKNTEEIYHYLTTLGTDYLQFIPCIDSFEGSVQNNTLSNDEYEEFLKRLFDVWYLDFKKGKRISIRYFDDIIKMILGYRAESCTLLGYCSFNQVIEADGSVYPCDFYVLDEWKLGNIIDDKLNDLLKSEKANEFIKTSIGINEDCKVCKYYQLCRGGCKRNKEPFEIVEAVKTRFCGAIYSFFDYTIERFTEIANVLDEELKQR